MIVIDGLFFDHKRGAILIPEADAIPFRASNTPGIGVQITAKRGPGFTLTLTRFDIHEDIVAVKNSLVARIGTTVSIVEYLHTEAINYSLPRQGYLAFRVTQARIIEEKMVAAFSGYRLGEHVIIEPAVKTVSQWTMYAIPRP